jgi:galactose-1-phosphate uridylyltransferase
MEFKIIKKTATFLDPFNKMALKNVAVEVRQDPLTGRNARIRPFTSLTWTKPDLEALAAGTEARCPFCPQVISKITPNFPEDILPEGRLADGDLLLFPNIAPYDSLSAVVSLGEKHLVPMTGFEPERIARAFALTRRFFDRLESIRHPESVYHLINWNYMPPAGSSVIHSHLQVFASSTATNLLRAKLDAARAYTAEHGTNFWDDLVKAEKGGERWIGDIGRTRWLSVFAPQGLMGDVTAVVDGAGTLFDLTDEDHLDLGRGIVRVLAGYDRLGVYSFNMGMYAGARNDAHARLHLVLSPRLIISPAIGTSDISSLQHLQGDAFCLVYPEEIARKIRETF